MEKPQIEKLLQLYKLAVEKGLSAVELTEELLEARKKMDKSFTKAGSEDEDLGEYVKELIFLKDYAV